MLFNITSYLYGLIGDGDILGILFIRYFISSLGQVDLWTRKATGCSCSWQRADGGSDRSGGANASDDGIISNVQNNQNCACCVKGGCQCGIDSPARCGQCGLEQYCVNSKFSSDNLVVFFYYY